MNEINGKLADGLSVNQLTPNQKQAKSQPLNLPSTAKNESIEIITSTAVFIVPKANPIEASKVVSTINEFPYRNCIMLPTDQLNKEVLNFREILQLFNCAISQEQAWSVLYQVLVEFKYLMENNLELVKQNCDNIDINVLNFTKDGVILFKFKTWVNVENFKLNASSYEQERQIVEPKILKSIAYLIFDALDYGNNYSNEPALQSSLSHLLLLISGHYKEYRNPRVQSEDDEGYEQEEEDSICLDKAIEICTSNVNEAEYHYKAVCRGLYMQAYELKVFLAKIEDSKNVLQKAGKDNTKNYCFELLDKTDWAKLWMQVIHELRHGVKLRKVSEKPYEMRRHIEYELTPFEILLDQIRARKYHLKKVSMDTSLAPEVKKDARDIILEFIRSRPPLKKSSQRKLNKARSQPTNLHEQLMNSIRNYSTPLRKTEVNIRTVKLSKDSPMTSIEIEMPKRLLKVDKKLLNQLTSSDDDESDIDYDDLKNLPILPEDDTLDLGNLQNFNSLLMNITANYSSGARKKRIRPPDSLRSPLAPIWIEPVETWRALVTEDVLIDTNNRLDMSNNQNHSNNHNANNLKKINSKSEVKASLPRRHTMNLADLNSISNNLASLNIFSGLRLTNKNRKNKSCNNDEYEDYNASSELEENDTQKVSDDLRVATSRLTTPIYLKSGPGYDDFGYVSTQELVKKLKSNDQGECLKLTFDELCHIRNVLTKAELDYLLFDNQLFNDVAKGKVCFSCRKTKFNLFNFNWGHKCQICQQKICKKCLRNAQIKNGQIAQVPLFKLGPNKYINVIEKSISPRQPAQNQLFSTSQVINSTFCASSHHRNHEKTFADTSSLDSRSLTDYRNLNGNRQQQAQFQIKLLEICVDCYQIMDGVEVSTSLNDLTLPCDVLTSKNTSLDPNVLMRKSSNKGLIKSAHLNNSKQHMHEPEANCGSNSSSNSDLNTIKSSGSNSPSIVMQSLSSLDIVNNQQLISRTTSAESPVFVNTIQQRLSIHSTPTKMIPTPDTDKNELSNIILNPCNLENWSSDYVDMLSSSASSKNSSSNETDQFHSMNSSTCNNKNFKSLKGSLTLDLRQVYSDPVP